MYQASSADLAGEAGGKVVDESSFFRLPVIEEKEDRVFHLRQHIIGSGFPVGIADAESLAHIVFANPEMNGDQRTARIFCMQCGQLFIYRSRDVFRKCSGRSLRYQPEPEGHPSGSLWYAV